MENNMDNMNSFLDWFIKQIESSFPDKENVSEMFVYKNSPDKIKTSILNLQLLKNVVKENLFRLKTYDIEKKNKHLEIINSIDELIEKLENLLEISKHKSN
jgi:hypothetical protein